MEEEDFSYNASVIKQLREEQEVNKQVLHEYKRKILTYEVLERDYQEEIERLNNDKKKVQLQLEMNFEKMEEEKTLWKYNIREELETLQNKLLETENEKEQLKHELKLAKQTQSTINIDETDREENEGLREKIIDLESIVENLDTQLIMSKKESEHLKELDQVLKTEKDDLQQSLDFTREELRKANELIQDLQDDIMCLKTEIDSLRNKPLDVESRGNSLFAEVNDSRVQLLKKLKTMMVRYNEMASDRENLLKEVESLRNDKTRLLKLFENDIQQYRPGNQSEIDAYKSTIEGYKKLLENYKQELSDLKKSDGTCPDKDLKYYETHLKLKEKEIQTMRETLEQYSLNQVIQARNLSQCGTEMVNWKWKASQFENQVSILEKKLKEICEKSETDTNETDEDKSVKEVNASKVKVDITLKDKTVKNLEGCNKSSILKERDHFKNRKTEIIPVNIQKEDLQENNLRSEETNKENNGTIIDLTDDGCRLKKNVHFSESTETGSEKVSVRRRGTCIVKPLPISNYSKKN